MAPVARVLCLHGYAQSAAFFRQRTGAFRKALKSEVGEFTFVDGTHPSTAAFVAGESADGDRGEKLGWWNVAEPDSRPAISSAYVGVEESLEHLESVCKTQGPFDGVLGFSQGATLAALLCLRRLHPFRFAILIAGFVPRDPLWAAAFEPNACALPSFHIYGTSDESVPPDRALALASCFGEAGVRTARLHEHTGGHVVPTPDAGLRSALKEFVRAQAAPSAGGAAADAPASGKRAPKAEKGARASGAGGDKNQNGGSAPAGGARRGQEQPTPAPAESADDAFARNFTSWRLISGREQGEQQ